MAKGKINDEYWLTVPNDEEGIAWSNQEFNEECARLTLERAIEQMNDNDIYNQIVKSNLSAIKELGLLEKAMEKEKKGKKREVKRININVPVDTLERIDEYAEKMSINRTSAILVLVTNALDSQKAMNSIDEFVKMVKQEQEKAGKE